MEVPGRVVIPLVGLGLKPELRGVFGSRGGPTPSLTRLRPSSILESKLESNSDARVEDAPVDRVRRCGTGACNWPLEDVNTSSSFLFVSPAARSPSPIKLRPPTVPNRPSELPLRWPWRLPALSNDSSGSSLEGEDKSSDHRI